MIAVAVGLSLAITIIAASHGIDTEVRSQLDPLSSNGNFQQNIDTIHSVLGQTRDLLTKLSIGFTAALVGLITWVTMGQRRRDIGIALQQGEHRSTVIMELLGEALILCFIGGFVGVVLGYMLCNVIHTQLSLLPLNVDPNDIPPIFLATILLSFVVTGMIATYLANQRDTSVSL